MAKWFIQIIFWFFFLMLQMSCSKSKDLPEKLRTTQKLATIPLRFDTLNASQRMAVSDSMAQLFKTDNDTLNPVYHYFKAYQFKLNNENERAKNQLQKIAGSIPAEWKVLKSYEMLNISIANTTTIPSGTFNEIYQAIQEAEKQQSQYTYRYYDLLAKAYFNNRQTEKAKEFSDVHFQKHPFKSHPIIKQRYFDISFLLAERLGEEQLMQTYLDSCRTLATRTLDSLALMRTYEYEAQLRIRQNRFDEAIQAEKLYFDYLKKNNNLYVFAFNNLAQLYLKAKRYNEALSYYQQGLNWANEHHPESNLNPIYNGMSGVYAIMGDYKNAYITLDSLVQWDKRNAEKIQAQKIAELHAAYDTEKKETAIKILESTNATNQKIIAQQKWMFGISALVFLLVVLFMYNYYRQRVLSEQNKHLALENKKLLLEQKYSQMQLNPHFIFNAISNLQGLIGSGNKRVANEYLVAFSKLMRHVLEHNRQDFISLEQEIESLKNYLKLQQIRYENKFEYTIEINGLDTENIGVPPMLLQPFVENTIEHGFKKIDYLGQIHIQFAKNVQQLQITITDNGTSTPKPMNPSKKSLSTKIIQERLDLLFNRKELKAGFQSRRLNNENQTGYEVILHFPIEPLN
ncbi:tetratricopeptide repeat-containing sensor histidine kinase [Paenimyroides aestuarii]|uniref:Histidine kinase n=1 Tax=Paenimyroides aestuarii TaxID=2968490 RepID=A0ABY5NQX5_9FLAO|nr:histidine kinase [Paenimyroides aestuarii]UUV20863.1 histidine kinase [Paenimyroides aestuarii]